MSKHALAAALPPALARAENLPSMPAVAVEVLRLTGNEDATLDELAGVIAMDPALAARLLKLSNSAAFNMGSEVTTLQRACMVLGMKTVKLMALSFSLVSSLRTTDAGPFDYEEYWHRSVVCAVAARALAGTTQSRLGDEAFLCGLLARLGQLVLARCLPVEYELVLLRANGTWPEVELEQECLGFTSCDVCGALMRSWELPARIFLPVEFRDERCALPSDATTEVRELWRILRIASRCEELVCGVDKPSAKQVLDREAAAAFGMSGEAIERFLVSLQESIRQTGELLEVDVKELDISAVLEQAKTQIFQVGLGVAMENRQAERERQLLTNRNRELSSKANTDALTGLPNRARFDEVLTQCVHQRLHASAERALGLLMIDVDRFKRINDAHGHQVGDEVLRMVGKVIGKVTRTSDVPARYGGEEFVVILPEANPLGLASLAERVRSHVEKEYLVVDGKRLSVTVSIGGAGIEKIEHERDGLALIRLADQYLYKAKKAGRNRTELYPGAELPR